MFQKMDPDSNIVSWQYIPSETLTSIFTYLPMRDRYSASATCTKWRNVFFLPIFWRRVTLTLSARRDGARAEFLCKIARYIRYLKVIWPHPWVLDQRNVKRIDNIRPIDKGIANSLTIFFQALSHNTCLKSLILKLENFGSLDVNFSSVVIECLCKVFKSCRGLEIISLGHHPQIIWNEISSEAKYETVQELHISCAEEMLNSSSPNREKSTSVLVSFCDLQSFTKLRILSINWSHITPNVIQSLCNRSMSATALEKLVIYLNKQHYNCNESYHPSEQQWKKLTSLNPQLKICLVILNALTTLCSAVRNIVGNVHMLKFLECDEINEAPFSNLMNWFKDTLKAHVYVSTKRPIDLPNGERLYEHAMVCSNLQYLSILGYYIEDSDLLAIACSFPKLEHLHVTKSHILTFALATTYMVPISGTKYAKFQTQMSEHMKKPWSALTSLPLDELFFTEGRDDDFYLTGKLSNIKNTN